MILVRLNGGLGNQMFQYATGFMLAFKNDDVLKLDISGYQNIENRRQIYRNLDIKDFTITAAIASPQEVSQAKNPLGSLSKILRLLEQKIFKRYYIDWHPEILKKVGNIYLDGYFQSEKYFIGNENLIRAEFSLKSDLYKNILPLIDDIKNKPVSVSLHVRRGDYVEDPRARRQHLVCDISYYERAVSEMQKKYPNLHLYIFSDDPQWVRNSLSFNADVTYISANENMRIDLKPSQEMVLMSKCDHHIISNSSFSWWGAYLNKAENKTILAPDIWNRGPVPQINILPEGWIKFPVVSHDL
ncbi:alpha-1,2-fucosyltransferase [Polynucleobacter sp. AP-Capit-er-40B-B4]|uniref:alpha-1,2-fucosyltransferase n=1 Tax=Polynucleobacter sp. AP-Capit-er-40B-B4 TaxID=2576927 RepID=UPI001C0ADBEE|nr:alpha-1,2-fucosyltransferase [Polynucleobacter sp. AP-Capit-er-40B-B4]MBU3580976.1 alpha-1,2-fucosyltransferase [Polynucleobacter sp. AP-Capit-er-40B-B4]